MADVVSEDAALDRAQQLRDERNRLLKTNARFSLPFGLRLPLAAGLSFVSGMALGLSHGSQAAGLRFRAENAHRLPQTPTGWYFYHKSKNYHMALGGVKEGMKMGARVGFWVVGFFSIEEMFDRYRGTKDFVNTVLASLSVAGGFSLWNRFPITTAARTAKGGLAIGLAYGLAQDAVAAAKGQKPRYMDFLLRQVRQRKGNATASNGIVPS